MLIRSHQDLIRKALQKPSPNPQAIIRHARTAYFTRVLGFPLSPESYAAFLAANPCHTPADDSLLAIIQGVPAWQVAAPKADLFVDKTVRDSGDGPSYPGRFAELIRCIKEGTPVPGVREIPDTILRDPVSFTDLLRVRLSVLLTDVCSPRSPSGHGLRLGSHGRKRWGHQKVVRRLWPLRWTRSSRLLTRLPHLGRGSKAQRRVLKMGRVLSERREAKKKRGRLGDDFTMRVA